MQMYLIPIYRCSVGMSVKSRHSSLSMWHLTVYLHKVTHTLITMGKVAILNGRIFFCCSHGNISISSTYAETNRHCDSWKSFPLTALITQYINSQSVLHSFSVLCVESRLRVYVRRPKRLQCYRKFAPSFWRTCRSVCWTLALPLSPCGKLMCSD